MFFRHSSESKCVTCPLEGDAMPVGTSPTHPEPRIIPFGSNRMWMSRRCNTFSVVFWSSYTENIPPSCAWPFSPDTGPHLHSWHPDLSLFLPTALPQEYHQDNPGKKIKQNKQNKTKPQKTYTLTFILVLRERDGERKEVAIKRDNSASKSLYLSVVKLW